MITKKFRFVAGRLDRPIGFTDDKVYPAWQRPGYEDRPLRTWHCLNDNGHERVFIPNEPTAHVIPYNSLPLLRDMPGARSMFVPEKFDHQNCENCLGTGFIFFEV